MCNFLKTENKLNGFNRICLSVGHHEALHSRLWEEWRNKLIFQEFNIKFPSLSDWAWEREGKRLDSSAQMNVQGLYASETYSHIVNMWIRPFSRSQQKYQYRSRKWNNAAALQCILGLDQRWACVIVKEDMKSGYRHIQCFWIFR